MHLGPFKLNIYLECSFFSFKFVIYVSKSVHPVI